MDEAKQWIDSHLPFDIGVAKALIDLERRVKGLEWLARGDGESPEQERIQELEQQLADARAKIKYLEAYEARYNIEHEQLGEAIALLERAAELQEDPNKWDEELAPKIRAFVQKLVFGQEVTE